MRRQELQPCGTYAAYQRHMRRGETACAPCQTAATAKQQAYRRNNRQAYRRELGRNAARSRALERLADEYPERFAVLLNEERLPLYLPEVTP
jgi:hypothetical protein